MNKSTTNNVEQEKERAVGRVVLASLFTSTGNKKERCEVKVLVHVLDVKAAFGEFEYLIQPVGGEGSRWVRQRLTFPEES